MFEPTIGNHDQNFLDNWYLKLKQLSLPPMKDIGQFWEKTIYKSNYNYTVFIEKQHKPRTI